MLTSLKIEKIIIKCIWQTQFTYKWISHIYPLCSHTRSYHQLLSDLRSIVLDFENQFYKGSKITDFGFTQMPFLGDGLIDARKDELNKKTFFTIRLLGLKICDLISYLSSSHYDPPRWSMITAPAGCLLVGRGVLHLHGWKHHRRNRVTG